jgi:hypothetical protein
MWQGGRAISGKAEGFQAVITILLLFGLFLIYFITSAN